MSPGEITALMGMVAAISTTMTGFVMALLNWAEQRRQANKKDSLINAEVHSEFADATDTLAKSMAQIAKAGQEFVEQARADSEEAHKARKSAEVELHGLRGAYELLVKSHDELAREFASFRKQCEADKLRYELAIGHLQATVDALNKNTQE